MGQPQQGPPEPLSARVRSLRLSQQVAAGNGNHPWVAWTFCFVFAGTTVVLGLLLAARPGSQAAQPAQGTDDVSPAAAAGQAPAGEIALESKGYIVPARQILVSPQVSGRIVELARKKVPGSDKEESLREGMRFQQGELLARLEDIDYRADHQRAQAMRDLVQQRLLELENGSRKEEKEKAAAELEEAKKQLEQYRSMYERCKELVKTKAISQDDFEQVEYRVLAMEQRVISLEKTWRLVDLGPREERIEAAKAELRQAEAELSKARWRLDNTVITAPISGTILKKNAEEGNICNPIAFNGSFSLCEMADLSDLEVDLAIQERDIARIFQGQKCKVRTEAFPDRVYEGFVSRLMPIADRAKGAIPVRVKVQVPKQEEGMYLKPEMGAIVSFLGAPPTGGPAAGAAAALSAEAPDAPASRQ